MFATKRVLMASPRRTRKPPASAQTVEAIQRGLISVPREVRTRFLPQTGDKQGGFTGIRTAPKPSSDRPVLPKPPTALPALSIHTLCRLPRHIHVGLEHAAAGVAAARCRHQRGRAQGLPRQHNESRTSRHGCTNSRPLPPSTRPGTRPTMATQRKPNKPMPENTPNCKTRLAARCHWRFPRGTRRSATMLATAHTRYASTKQLLIRISYSTTETEKPQHGSRVRRRGEATRQRKLHMVARVPRIFQNSSKKDSNMNTKFNIYSEQNYDPIN